MDRIPILLKETDQEAQTARKFLERGPIEKFTWKPHEKSSLSMRIGGLARIFHTFFI